ncbi:MAG: phospho-N-acetylmuramoyl-pentapeptide-transferase, partial [Myxococcota bacterium]
MLYALFVEPGPLSDVLPGANVFRYITFRTAWGMLTALAITYVMFPRFIDWMRQRRVDQIIRNDGPESHLLNKVGTPTMGGVCILAGVSLSTLVWCKLDEPAVWLVLIVMLGYGLIGFVDDWKKVMYRDPAGLAGRLKILGQLVFGGAALVYGYYAQVFPPTLAIPFFKGPGIDFAHLWTGAPMVLGWLFVAFAMFLLVAESNGVNLTDGLDGLAIGPTMTCAATYGLIAYLAGNARFAE